MTSVAAQVAAVANRSDFKGMNTYDSKGRQGPHKWKKVVTVELLFWDGTVIKLSRDDFDVHCRDVTFSLGQIDSPEAKRRDA